MIKKIQLSDFDSQMLSGLDVCQEDLKGDACDYSKVVVKKPWGYEYLIFQYGVVAGWVLYLKQGAQTSTHCHIGKKTSLIVLEGEVLCSVLKEDFRFSPGDGLLIDKGVFHQTKALSENGAFVLEIETPANKTDLVRLKDEYGRVGKGYEKADQHSINTQNYNYLSFSTRQIHHNLKKCFGQCSLNFHQFENDAELLKMIVSDEENIFCLLEGELFDNQSRFAVGAGDTLTMREMKKHQGLKGNFPIRALVIKKIDHLVKVSDYIVSFLKLEKVHNVFFVPGDGNVHLLDSIGRAERLNFVCTQMETGASMAAEAYAKLQCDLGVLIISSGASGPNALRGVANAWVDSTPLLVISGQAKSKEGSLKVRQPGNKALNIVDVVQPITKYAVKINDPSLIRYHLEKAVFLAKTEGRHGPVWLDIPIDVQGMVIDANELKGFNSSEEFPEKENDKADLSSNIEKFMALLQASKRPVFLVGNGIRQSVAVFKDFVDRLGIPTLTSRSGADLLAEDHPFFFGRPGACGQRRANFIIQNCDLLIGIGCRLSIPLIGGNAEAFARTAKKISIDIDIDELQKETVKLDLAIHSDAGHFMEEVFRYLQKEPVETKRWSKWVGQCKNWAKMFPPLSEKYEKTDLVQPYHFVQTLSERLGQNEVIVVDGGSSIFYMMQGFQFKEGQRIIGAMGLELPGFALPGALGAAVGHEKSQVFCLCEDRGFMMGIQELETISRYALPIKFFVLRSKGHFNIRQIQRDFFGGRLVGTDQDILFETPSVAAMARLYKLPVCEIKTAKEMPSQMDRVLEMEGPVICEVHVEGQQDLIPRQGFTIREDGRWLAKPLEDMYPYLPRETLKDNMFVGVSSED